MQKEFFLKTNLDNESNIVRQDFEPSKLEEIKIKHEQKRKDKQENVKHFIAGIVILPYIFILLMGCLWSFNIPKAYETLALIVIGYYFAKHI